MVSLSKNELFLIAVGKNNLKKCENLIKDVENINIKDDYGMTALIYASCWGYKDMCSLLLKNGADVNIKDNYGNTSLIYASLYGYKNTCLSLLENGANIEEKNKKNRTALILAYIERYKEVISLLISSGCNYSSNYKRISYNRLSLLTFRTFMIENIRNQKDIKLKDLIKIVPEEILDDINNNSVGYCLKCRKHFYYYRYELKLKDLKRDEIINVKVHCL